MAEPEPATVTDGATMSIGGSVVGDGVSEVTGPVAVVGVSVVGDSVMEDAVARGN